jgi:4-hydroxybenzoate polyprenyltransferase
MANSVYVINKGINKSIEFKGLKAQYIWYLAGCILLLLLLFAVLAVIGINQYICLVAVLPLGGFLVWKVYLLSHKYGEHGLMKTMAGRSVPKLIKSKSRQVFLTGNQHGK